MVVGRENVIELSANEVFIAFGIFKAFLKV